MDGIEAIRSMRDGKKVRRPTWGSSDYWYFDAEKVMSAAGREVTFAWPVLLDPSYDWELYNVPLTNKEVPLTNEELRILKVKGDDDALDFDALDSLARRGYLERDTPGVYFITAKGLELLGDIEQAEIVEELRGERRANVGSDELPDGPPAPSNPQEAVLKARVKEIFRGIEDCQDHCNEGWWSTTEGAAYGYNKLEDLLVAIEQTFSKPGHIPLEEDGRANLDAR